VSTKNLFLHSGGKWQDPWEDIGYTHDLYINEDDDDGADDGDDDNRIDISEASDEWGDEQYNEYTSSDMSETSVHRDEMDLENSMDFENSICLNGNVLQICRVPIDPNVVELGGPFNAVEVELGGTCLDVDVELVGPSTTVNAGKTKKKANNDSNKKKTIDVNEGERQGQGQGNEKDKFKRKRKGNMYDSDGDIIFNAPLTQEGRSSAINAETEPQTENVVEDVDEVEDWTRWAELNQDCLDAEEGYYNTHSSQQGDDGPTQEDLDRVDDDLINLVNTTKNIFVVEEGVHLKKNPDVNYDELKIGMMWPTVFETRKFIRHYGIVNKFKFYQVKNENYRVRLRCCDEDCEWLFYARRMSNGQTFKLMGSSNLIHNCKGKGGDTSKLANATWVAKEVE
ncbi:hypothetical protein GIB67_004072, partial [Kingdonia uniflora]